MVSKPLTRLLTSNIRSLLEEVIIFSCKVAFPAKYILVSLKLPLF